LQAPDLIEPEWQEWMVFDQRRPAPPEPKEFWRSADWLVAMRRDFTFEDFEPGTQAAG
jgi:hypothetical protein